jgi:hypothetical protein
VVEYGTDIVGVEGRFALYQSEAVADMSSKDTFEAFLEDPLTAALVQSPTFRIGKRSLDRALLKVAPSLVVDEASLVDTRILGIPSTYKDTNKTVLVFEKNSNVDGDGKVPLLPAQKGAEEMTLSIDFDVDYLQRTQTN